MRGNEVDGKKITDSITRFQLSQGETPDEQNTRRFAKCNRRG